MINYSLERGRLTICADVEHIEKGLYTDRKDIERIVFPDGLKSIGALAFKGCENLEEVEFSDSITMIGDRAFSECKKLKKVDIPKGVSVINPYSFSNCDSLEQIHIPGNVKKIGMGAFSGNPCLSIVELDEGIEEIDGHAFAACSSLKAVFLPKSLQRFHPWQLSFPKTCITQPTIEIEGVIPPNHKYDKDVGMDITYNQTRGGALCCVQLVEKDDQSRAMILLSEKVDKQVVKEGKVDFGEYDSKLLKKKLGDLPTEYQYLGMVYRIRYPYMLSDENRNSYYQYIGKNYKKLIMFAEELSDTDIIEGLFIAGAVTDKNKKQVFELLSNSSNEIVSKMAQEMDKLIEKKVNIENEPTSASQDNKKASNDFTVSKGVLIRYKGSGGSVTVPEGVTTIGTNAFQGREDITSIVIPERVNISAVAFSGCTGLANEDGYIIIRDCLFGYDKKRKTLEIPKGVIRISAAAFAGELGTTRSISIPDSVSEIDDSAFGHTWKNSISFDKKSLEIPNLEKVIIPDGLVKKIGLTGLKRCFDLNSLTLSLLKNQNNYAGELKNKIISYIKNNKNEIADYCIKNDNADMLASMLELIKLNKPSELDQLREKAEKVINRPNSIIALLLDYKASHNSDKKTKTQIIDQLETELGEKELSVSEWRKIFKFSIREGEILITGYKGSDTHVVVPEKIGKNTVTGIGKEAFSHKGIHEIELPDTIHTIENGAFKKASLKSICIPEGVRIINSDVFRECFNLTSVEFPKKLERIDNFAFLWCKELQEVAFPDGLKTIGSSAFLNCEKIHEIRVPESVTRISARAFSGIESLEKLIIANSSTKIEHHAFSRISKKGFLYDSEGIMTVNGFLIECSGEKSEIKIPKTVDVITSYSFSYLDKIRKVVVPANVRKIEYRAFDHCSMLEEIIITGDTEIEVDAVYGCDSARIIRER